VPVVPSMSITAWLPREALKARTAGRAVARSAALAIRFRAWRDCPSRASKEPAGPTRLDDFGVVRDEIAGLRGCGDAYAVTVGVSPATTSALAETETRTERFFIRPPRGSGVRDVP